MAFLAFLAVAGNLTMAAILCLIGPSPFLPFHANAKVILAALFVGGVAYGFNVVSSFARSSAASRRKGYSDDINTYVMLSGTLTENR